MKMLMLVLVVGLLALVGCSNPKTVTCKECGSSAVRCGGTILNGVPMDAYQCPNHHLTYLKR